MELNPFQKENLAQIESSKENWDLFLQGNWARCDIQKFLRCVACGKGWTSLTKPIIRFFGNDVSKVKCWDCQETNREYGDKKELK